MEGWSFVEEELSTYLVRSAVRCFWHVVDVVGVAARLTSKKGGAVFEVASMDVRMKDEV